MLIIYIHINAHTHINYTHINQYRHIHITGLDVLITHSVRFHIQSAPVCLPYWCTQCRSQAVLCSLCSALDCVRLGVTLPSGHWRAGMQTAWRDDLSTDCLEKRMFWGNTITLFRYLKRCQEQEWLDSSWLAPGGTKLGLMDRNLREGERVLLRLRKDVWPKESLSRISCSEQSFSPRQMQELRLDVSLTGAVIIAQGASAVGRRGCYRNPMISSKYQF